MDQKTYKLLVEIENIFSFSKSENKVVFLLGWFAVDSAFGSITRNHHDIDIMIEEIDLKFWKEWFIQKGFECKKYQKKSQNNCFYFEKDWVIIDVGSFYYQDNQVFDRCDFDEKPFLWPTKKDKLFRSWKLSWISLNFASPEILLFFRTMSSWKLLRENDLHDIEILKKLI